LATEKTILKKTIEIQNAGEILKFFDSQRIAENYPGFSAYVSFTSSKKPEFRVEVGDRKLQYSLWPILYPNRRLLEERPSENALLVCPHIAEPIAADLRQGGIPHADLNGRLFLRTATGLVDIRPSEIRYRSPKPGPDPFSFRAARIVRSLLCHRDKEWTQEALSLKTGASRPLVSQVLGQLEEQDWVKQVSTSAPGRPGQYRLEDFDGLLNAWQQQDEWPQRGTIHEYSVLSNKAEEIASKLVDAAGYGALAFTQWFAAWLRRPHTTPPIVSAYVKRPHILNTVPARRVNTGGNLWLIVPEDDGVWQDGIAIGGFPLVSDVQTYLDLLQVGQRGPETAAELRKWEGFAR
jgi:hypothetical protein